MTMAERDPQEMLSQESQQVEPTQAEAAAVKAADPRRKKVMLGLAAGILLAGGG